MPHCGGPRILLDPPYAGSPPCPRWASHSARPTLRSDTPVPLGWVEPEARPTAQALDPPYAGPSRRQFGRVGRAGGEAHRASPGIATLDLLLSGGPRILLDPPYACRPFCTEYQPDARVLMLHYLRLCPSGASFKCADHKKCERGALLLTAKQPLDPSPTLRVNLTDPAHCGGPRILLDPPYAGSPPSQNSVAPPNFPATPASLERIVSGRKIDHGAISRTRQGPSRITNNADSTEAHIAGLHLFAWVSCLSWFPLSGSPSIDRVSSYSAR